MNLIMRSIYGDVLFISDLKGKWQYTGITLQVVQRGRELRGGAAGCSIEKDFQSDVIDISVIAFMLILMEDSAVHVKDRITPYEEIFPSVATV
ncbi:hypothetical protein HAX54_042701 [Datura stramonium]|uniref:Uncharacterized protein n=1 Tax=Datura stramonium TaxID=4076 RepID=A0ABS8W1M3_DATST|nr:hypothetical protein [Datura stramonium]